MISSAVTAGGTSPPLPEGMVNSKFLCPFTSESCTPAGLPVFDVAVAFSHFSIAVLRAFSAAALAVSAAARDCSALALFVSAVTRAASLVALAASAVAAS